MKNKKTKDEDGIKKGKMKRSVLWGGLLDTPWYPKN